MISNDLAWLASISNRATEEAIALRLVAEPWAGDVRKHVGDGEFRVISARRASNLMRERLFDQVHALLLAVARN